jgi:hypothetical protein
MLQEVFQQLLQNTYTSDTLYQRIRLLKEYYETHLYSQNILREKL